MEVGKLISKIPEKHKKFKSFPTVKSVWSVAVFLCILVVIDLQLDYGLRAAVFPVVGNADRPVVQFDDFPGDT